MGRAGVADRRGLVCSLGFAWADGRGMNRLRPQPFHYQLGNLTGSGHHGL